MTREPPPFFFPFANTPEEAEALHGGIARFAEETTGWEVLPRRIWRIEYVHDGRDFVAEVGVDHLPVGEPVIAYRVDFANRWGDAWRRRVAPRNRCLHARRLLVAPLSATSVHEKGRAVKVTTRAHSATKEKSRMPGSLPTLRAFARAQVQRFQRLHAR